MGLFDVTPADAAEWAGFKNMFRVSEGPNAVMPLIDGSDVAAVKQSLYRWLDFGSTEAGTKIHWGFMRAGALQSWLGNNIQQPLGFTAAAGEVINKAVALFSDPNIEGIIIKSEYQSTVRDVDVSKQVVVAQDSSGTGSKQWVTDNAAPHPRTWQVRGYLKTYSNAVDAYLTIKPTILAQLNYLDLCASSRRPVWFKPFYTSFHHVLIEHFDYEFDPKAQNAVMVNISMCEFIPNMAYTNKAGLKIASRVEPIGSSSPGSYTGYQEAWEGVSNRNFTGYQ